MPMLLVAMYLATSILCANDMGPSQTVFENTNRDDMVPGQWEMEECAHDKGIVTIAKKLAKQSEDPHDVGVG